MVNAFSIPHAMLIIVAQTAVKDSNFSWCQQLQEQDIVLHVQQLTIVFNVMKKMLILVQFVIMVFMSKLMDNVLHVIQIVLIVKVVIFVQDVNLDGLFWRIILRGCVWLVKDLA